MERLHTTRWKLSTLRDGRSPHYAVEGLHTTRWNVSTLRGGTSPYYAMEGLHTMVSVCQILWLRPIRSYGFGLSDHGFGLSDLFSEVPLDGYLKDLRKVPKAGSDLRRPASGVRNSGVVYGK
jgi:hypothetical protein